MNDNTAEKVIERFRILAGQHPGRLVVAWYPCRGIRVDESLKDIRTMLDDDGFTGITVIPAFRDDAEGEPDARYLMGQYRYMEAMIRHETDPDGADGTESDDDMPPYPDGEGDHVRGLYYRYHLNQAESWAYSARQAAEDSGDTVMLAQMEHVLKEMRMADTLAEALIRTEGDRR
ncbi:hypothetical protein [Bifidobacterium catulorum]|uniref:Uncharacterized protein n=1 Tax=Bifidobacterium catulorum TaxID=1630173 RepID=A0A2U2MUG7_9BIFI|nr:hypothetical protein [Bifidobacterium catulorum]PWG60486.1 hypothetical protein DF200_02500 [Bifidobacterium catulorum]